MIRGTPLLIAGLSLLPVVGATVPASPLRQDFSHLTPADLRTGDITMTGEVQYTAEDGSWFKIEARSSMGFFTFRLTRIGTELAPMPLSEAFDLPPEVKASRDLFWHQIGDDNGPKRIQLEGEIISVLGHGQELEARLAFKDETVRVRFDLRENVEAGRNPAPTLRNVAFGPEPGQSLDFYRAKSEKPTPVAIYIHSGSWLRGDKSELGQFSYYSFLEAGVSVVSINYRFCPSSNPSSEIPAVAIPLGDAARAIQYVRHRASEWGLDRERLGVWGWSAGACSVLWLATHADLADAANADEVLRESSRPRCAVAMYAQTSLDPRQMRAWVGPGITYGAHAFGISDSAGQKASFERFYGARNRLSKWIGEYSPATLITADGPPIYLDYGDLSLSPTKPLSNYFTHSPRFGVGFDKLCRDAGRPCYLRYSGLREPSYGTWQAFMIANLAK